MFGDRAGHGAAHLPVRVVATGAFEDGAGFEARRASRDVQHAGRRVLAEQRALRAAQQRDLVDVDEIEVRHARAAQVHVVEIRADTGFERIVGHVVAEAAHREAHLPRIGDEHVGAGQTLVQIFEAELADTAPATCRRGPRSEWARPAHSPRGGAP